MHPHPSDQGLRDLQAALERALEIADAQRLSCIGAHIDMARAAAAQLLADRGLGDLTGAAIGGSDQGTASSIA